MMFVGAKMGVWWCVVEVMGISPLYDWLMEYWVRSCHVLHCFDFFVDFLLLIVVVCDVLSIPIKSHQIKTLFSLCDDE